MMYRDRPSKKMIIQSQKYLLPSTERFSRLSMRHHAPAKKHAKQNPEELGQQELPRRMSFDQPSNRIRTQTQKRSDDQEGVGSR